MERNNLIKTKCWSCWWREGSHCFSEDFGELPKEDILFIGHAIEFNHINQCKNSYLAKRAMLPFPKDKLIILSEAQDNQPCSRPKKQGC